MSQVRLFAGVGLPDEYQQTLGELSRQWRGRLKSHTTWTRQGNWHVTLKFMGEVEEARVDDVRDALDAVRFEPFAMKASGAGAFPSNGKPRVLWVGLEEGAEALTDLTTRVEDALEPLGFTREERPFRPHLTLCRVKRAEKDPWEEVKGELARISWPEFSVNEFTLWRSVLGPNGPSYAALAGFGATSV